MTKKLRSLFFLVFAFFGAAVTTHAQLKIYGQDFSPYLTGQDPNLNPQINASQILSRMQTVASYTTWVRSFSSTDGLENTPSIARQLGLKIAANAWISSNTAQNTLEINNLVAAANAGMVDVAIVGSEAILRGDVTVSQLIAYMSQVRQAIPSGIPVVTADVYGTFIANPALIAAGDQVWANFYPYWEGTSINNAVCSLEQEYQQLKTAAGSKTVVISETGWPSAGNAVGAAVPSAANENLYALQFFSWASANNIPAFYFESFDEQWKAAYEGPQGSHWGIWGDTGVIKPGMDAFFNGQTTTVNCNGPIPGPFGMSFVYVPPYGSGDQLEVQVTGVQPASYVIATYIEVAGSWWTKPTFAQPTVAINPDGTSRISIDTGGEDQLATNVAAFLIPSSVTPPLEGPGVLPTIPGTVATVQVSRTPNSINGIISDSQGNPIDGATISDPVLGKTTSAPDGKYSFYQITTSGTATLTVSYPNYVFPTSPYSLPIPNGNQIVNFSGSATVDLSVSEAASPTQPSVVSQVVITIVASNAGIATASDALVSVSLPSSFILVSTATTRGSCTVANLQITCNVGSLASTAYATITLDVTPMSPGSFNIPASVSGPDSDSNPTNNSTSLEITVSQSQTATSATLNSSANPSTFGQSVTLTAMVSPTTATGSVTFKDGPASLGTGTLNSGKVTLMLSTLSCGSHSLTAVYNGDANNLGSTSAILALTVNNCTVAGFDFYPVTPCRIADTRAGAGFTGQFGPPSMSGGAVRAFNILSSPCAAGIPATVAAYSLNFTVVPPAGGPEANLTTWPTGLATGMPNVSNLNYYGNVVANAAIVPAGTSGAIDVYASYPTDMLFDINGYFAPPLSSGLEFYPVTPCRIADTRTGAGFSGQFGPPSMAGGATRTFTVPSGPCAAGIPATVAAYSLNFTVVPPAGGPESNLTTWPGGSAGMPNVSTLNYYGGVVANAAIVPAGTNGAINAYVVDPTDMLFDINGYFAPASSSGLHFYPVTPCRITDTRTGSGFTGQFGPPSMAGGATRTFNILSSSCAAGIPATVAAYSLNFTVVPPAGGPEANLTTWPTCLPTPNVSTLNFYGNVMAGAAIVPTCTTGGINVYVSYPTDVLFDINGYFAP